MKKCPKCECEIQDELDLCPYCGQIMDEPVKAAKDTGKKSTPKWLIPVLVAVIAVLVIVLVVFLLKKPSTTPDPVYTPTTQGEVQNDTDDDGWAEAYQSYLRDKMTEEGATEYGFSLDYIDDDNIPELVFSPGNYHAAGATVLKYVDGNVIEVLSEGSWGTISYAERQGIMAGGYLGSGAETINVYKLEGNKAVLTWSGEEFSGYLDGDKPSYSINEESVDEATYRAEYAKNVPENMTTAGWVNQLTEENLAAQFGTAGTTAQDTTTQAPTTQPVDTGWIDAYQNYLRKKLQADNAEFAGFSLGYVDDDDVPELFFAEGDFHATGATVLKYVDGNVLELVTSGSFGLISYAPRQGIIVGNYTGSGASSDSVYKIEGNKAVNTWNGTSYDGSMDQSEPEYEIDEKPVDQQTYEKAYAQNVPANMSTGGYVNPLTEENIAKFVR